MDSHKIALFTAAALAKSAASFAADLEDHLKDSGRAWNRLHDMLAALCRELERAKLDLRK